MEHKKTLTILFAVIALLMTIPVHASHTTDFSAEDTENRDKLTDVNKKEQQRSTAIIEDVMGTFRLCLSRPVRLLHPFGPAPGKPSAKLLQASESSLCQILKTSRCRMEASPFQTAVSRHYYIIALRHLLC